MWLALLLVASWDMVEEGDRFMVEKQQDGALVRVRVTMVSHAAPKALAELAWDLKGQVRYTPNLKSVQILREEPSKILAYFQVAIPVIANRDYVAEVTRRTEASTHLMFIESMSEGPPVPAGFVRMRRVQSTWKFEPNEQGALVTLISYGDPGGDLPAWVVSMASTNGPRDVVRALVAHAEKEMK